MDEIVGRLVKYLKAHQLYDKSTILLVSDHGEGLGDHGEQGHGLLAYEEVLHIPLIVKRSAGEGAGRRVQDLVQHVDLVPTILEMARAPVPDTLDGRSLTPLLENTSAFPSRMAYGESMYGRYHFGWSEIRTATDGRYWFIQTEHPELYQDLLIPSSARSNLIGLRPGEATAFASWLDRLTAGSSVDELADTSTADRERLAALGYVGVHSAPALTQAEPDLKRRIAIVERYRSAMDRSSAKQWQNAIELFQDLLEEEPELAEGWGQLGATAFKAERFKLAADAYRRASAESPSSGEFHLGAAAALMRLRRMDEARDHAAAALAVAGTDPMLAAMAHETLTRVALAVRDSAEARAQAELAQRAEPGFPLPAYVEAYLLYEQGRFTDASILFKEAAAARTPAGRPIADLHFYAADALLQAGRAADAEPHLVEELRRFPRNHRARAALARLYHDIGQRALAMETASAIARIGQTPEAYQTAARLLAAFGNSRQAAALRAEGTQVFGKTTPSETRITRR